MIGQLNLLNLRLAYSNTFTKILLKVDIFELLKEAMNALTGVVQGLLSNTWCVSGVMMNKNRTCIWDINELIHWHSTGINSWGTRYVIVSV